MYPFPGPGQPEQGNLEDRLRGLILNNANPSLNPTEGPLNSSYLPPHMLKASPEEKAEYHARAQGPSQAPPPAAGRQKRPNQAQRRQMNSQTSIAIDPRPAANHAQARNGPGFGGHSQPQYHHGHQNRSPLHQQQFSPRYQDPQHHPRTQYNSSSQQSFPPNGPHPQNQPEFRTNSSAPPRPNGQQQGSRPPPQNRQLFHPGGPVYGQGRGQPFGQDPQEIPIQVSYLEKLLHEHVPTVGMDPKEETLKEEFRATIEQICREAIAEFERGLGNEEFDASSVQIQCFGSMQSGFATRSSDMDLALLAPNCVPAPDSAESRIPRLLEKNLLALGFGARLLTRTRVPIIKLCQKPTEKLLAGLREERTRWDNGVVEDDEDAAREAEKNPKYLSVDGLTTRMEAETLNNKGDPISHDTSLLERADASNLHSRAVPADMKLTETGQLLTSVTDTSLQSSTTQTPFTIADEAYQDRLSSLKQQNQQSLQDYHNSAKRLLRKLGGRDITANSPPLDGDEKRVLADVCRAFILGLASNDMSTRLQRYLSIKPLFDHSTSTGQRSLHGIWSQADGERFIMAWESRPFLEFNDSFESEASGAIHAWIALQDKINATLDTAFFGRQLFAGLEKLKKINSIQIMLLEQMPHEEPAFYFARTQRIQKTLRLHPESGTKEDLASFVVSKYIAGVNNPSIKAALESETLPEVSREHIKLQLAADYERALGLGLFEDGDIADVEKYVSLLQNHQIKNLNIEPEMVSKMRNLPDPTQVSILRPRDPYKDKLEFPNTDIGIQCDINFSARLAIHNTLLLRCYAASDPRVRPMVLFIKHWARVRGINTPYRGTLSSYGYVLMVLQYLVNVAQPFVCPNLQLVNKDPPNYLPPAEVEARSVCDGQDIRFWRNELEIKNLADRGMLNHNKDLLGFLLRGFFEYYAQSGQMTTVRERGFDWGREVLSLRKPGGILTKQEKGWTGAKTTIETSVIAAPPTPNTGNEPKASVKTMEETKEIRHRYLFAIEDPFEIDHNIARTVTHNGIVSIRDEFRRAWRIIKEVGKGGTENLLDAIAEGEKKNGLKESMDIIHGLKTGA